MKKVKYSLVICLLFASCLILSCRKDKQAGLEFGGITFNFSHNVDGQAVRFDTLVYVNNAGNIYMITDFQYFLSDFILYKSDGTQVKVTKADSHDIIYLDSAIPGSNLWDAGNSFPAGSYDSISFTFGINAQKNKTGLFVNPPEVNMFWPDMMGGGYHFMKLNGKWYNTANQTVPFNFHIGKGMTVNGTDTTFYDNSFRVKLPGSAFSLSNGQSRKINIVMNLDSWFKTPHTWDWNVTGGAIMQSQALMQMAKENGVDVFAIGSIQ